MVSTFSAEYMGKAVFLGDVKVAMIADKHFWRMSALGFLPCLSDLSFACR